MPLKILSIQDFLNQISSGLLIDVRSPSEFRQAHIPSACNHPILDDEQRKEVGITYKMHGNEIAVKKGYELVGHLLEEKILNIIEANSQSDDFYFYCWRGGQRSQIMANLLAQKNKNVFLLKGGYKNFRKFVLDLFKEKFQLTLLSGYTGSGKTEFLQLLQQKDFQVLDLEKMASHKGSAFGHLGLPKQPSNEMFENMLAFEMNKMDLTKNIWVEAESRRIGDLSIPEDFYKQMKSSKYYVLIVDKKERVHRILKEYGHFSKEHLKQNTLKVEKKMGPQFCKKAITFLEEDDYENWLDLLLNYYDKLYHKSMNERDPDTIKNFQFSWENDGFSKFFEELNATKF